MLGNKCKVVNSIPKMRMCHKVINCTRCCSKLYLDIDCSTSPVFLPFRTITLLTASKTRDKYFNKNGDDILFQVDYPDYDEMVSKSMVEKQHENMFNDLYSYIENDGFIIGEDPDVHWGEYTIYVNELIPFNKLEVFKKFFVDRNEYPNNIDRINRTIFNRAGRYEETDFIRGNRQLVFDKLHDSNNNLYQVKIELRDNIKTTKKYYLTAEEIVKIGHLLQDEKLMNFCFESFNDHYYVLAYGNMINNLFKTEIKK